MVNIKWNTRKRTRCGYEVLGLILLQAPYLYTYSLLRRVTFEVLLLSSYILSPKMLPLLETFLEILMWNTFQCRRHISWNYSPFKPDFISVNSQKSAGDKSGEQCGCSISVIDFWARNYLTESALWAGELSWWRIQTFGHNSGPFHCFFV